LQTEKPQMCKGSKSSNEMTTTIIQYPQMTSKETGTNFLNANA